jgi:hypothetical protein
MCPERLEIAGNRGHRVAAAGHADNRPKPEVTRHFGLVTWWSEPASIR